MFSANVPMNPIDRNAPPEAASMPEIVTAAYRIP